MILEEKQLPRQTHMVKFLKRAKASAPGSDGIPYAAWLASGSFDASALHLAIRVMMDGTRPPLGFNNSLGIFLPKGPRMMTLSTVSSDQLRIPDHLVSKTLIIKRSLPRSITPSLAP